MSLQDTQLQERTERLKRIEEALARKGIEGLSQINSAVMSGTRPATDEEADMAEASVLPIDAIPRGFTDEQHAARNKHLPAAPSREQFVKGMVRSYNIRLLAEDFTPALTYDELHYKSETTRKLEIIADLYARNRVNSVRSMQKPVGFQRFLSKNHRKITPVYHAITAFWMNFFGRAVILFGTLYVFTAAFS